MSSAILSHHYVTCELPHGSQPPQECATGCVHSPLFRLPHELLGRVLEFLQERLPYELLGYTPSLPSNLIDLEWRHIMLVCSRLREVAVQEPSLWATIDFRWPQMWINLCTLRAASHTLRFISIVDSQYRADQVARLIPLANDVHLSFPLKINQTFPLQQIHDVIAQPAPMLRSLEIKAVVNLWTLSASFLAGQCQNLTTLVIDHVDIRSIPDMPALRILHVLEFRISGRSSDIPALFAKVPNVRELTMISTGRSLRPPTSLSTSNQATPLGSLKSLSLHAQAEDTWAILRSLALPPTVKSISIVTRPDILARGEHSDLQSLTAVADMIQHLRGINTNLSPTRVSYLRLGGESSSDFEILVDTTGYMPNIYCRATARAAWTAHPVMRDLLRDTTDLSIMMSYPFLGQPAASTLGLETWPVVEHLPALKRLEVHTLPNTGDSGQMDELQAWADRRTLNNLPCVAVTMVNPELGWLSWRPESGQLKDARWTNYQGYLSSRKASGAKVQTVKLFGVYWRVIG